MNDEDKAMVREMIREEVGDALSIVAAILSGTDGHTPQDISKDWHPITRQKFLDYCARADERYNDAP